MKQEYYNRSIAYHYAMGRLDEREADADGNGEIALDFSKVYVDTYSWSVGVMQAWDAYVTELRKFVHVDLGAIEPADPDEPIQWAMEPSVADDYGW